MSDGRMNEKDLERNELNENGIGGAEETAGENAGKESALGKISKSTYILTAIVCLLPVIAGVILYPRLPDSMAIHWGANGAPNGWAGKWVGAILLPGMLLVIQLLMPFLIKADPKNKDLNPKVAGMIAWIMPAVSLICSSATLMAGLGMNPNIQITAPLFVGFIALIIGNYLPKTTRSYTVGIKLPWTLNSEENWRRTHRLGGFLMALAGICMIVSAFFPCRLVVFLAALGISVITPIVYSYVLYRKGI